METKTVNLNKFKREAKIREIKQAVTDKTKATIEWCTENKEGLAIAGVVIAGAGKIFGQAVKHHDLKVEQKLKDLKTYDHSTGAYVELKRKLRAGDIEQIQNLRSKTGCSYTDALMKLNLVRR